MERDLFDDEHQQFRRSVNAFVEAHVAPDYDDWERRGVVDRNLFTAAGRLGMLGLQVPNEYGGGGTNDFRFNAVFNEEFASGGHAGAGLALTLHNDITTPYFVAYTDTDQRERWLPGIASGELITAIAMTEPGAGSDLAAMSTTARVSGDTYVVNGSKTFITNGTSADLVITAVRTDGSDRQTGITLLVLEGGMAGFERSAPLEKIGLHSQDTAQLFFDDVRVPLENRLGIEGRGLEYLTSNLAQERLSIAVTGVAAARAALTWTLDHVRTRTVFGSTLASMQHVRFELADLATNTDVTQAFVDDAIRALNRGTLTAADAAKAKLAATRLQNDVVDRCLQLFGGYGFMREYKIARAYCDARVSTIYGGANEVMKHIIAKSMSL